MVDIFTTVLFLNLNINNEYIINQLQLFTKMSIIIKNIKIDEISFNSKNNKDFDKILGYVKLMVPDYKKFLPSNPKHRIQFEITNTVSDFANCIRRFLLDEILVYSMDVKEEDIKTDDKFILNDHFKKILELIPFQQNIKDIKNFKISIDVKNTSDDIMTIYTRDIKITDSKNNVLDSDKYFSCNIPMIQLRSDKSLLVNNISIVQGCGKDDSGKFNLLSNISYEILDVVPYEESKFENTGQSSLNSTPRQFKIGFTTYGNIEPKKVINLCCDCITNRLQNIQKELQKIKNETNIYFSESLELEIRNNVKIYHFKGEFWTISNIIARYCYIEFPEINFVCSNIIHPSKEESIVKIIHDNSINIINSAIVRILNDVSILKNKFK
jgi:DNA-directed RNA polymerase subunit L